MFQLFKNIKSFISYFFVITFLGQYCSSRVPLVSNSLFIFTFLQKTILLLSVNVLMPLKQLKKDILQKYQKVCLAKSF